MGVGDTAMGGSRNIFPQTTWSSILSIADTNSPERRERLNRLLMQYWRPVYKFIRASWGKSVEDAKDLTQAFFCHVVEMELVSRYEKEKGRFRHFLKGSLRNFLSKDHRDQTTLKRGGGRKALSLDVRKVNDAEFQVEARQFRPEEIFDRQWAREIMIAAVDRLQQALQEEGKEIYFRIFDAYTLRADPDRSPTYEELGKTFGVSVRTVENHLRYARARLHDLMLEQISDYVTSAEEVMEEMRELFSE